MTLIIQCRRQAKKGILDKKKSRIRETPTLSTNADSRSDTNLKRKRLSFFFLSLPAAVAAPAAKGLLGQIFYYFFLPPLLLRSEFYNLANHFFYRSLSLVCLNKFSLVRCMITLKLI